MPLEYISHAFWAIWKNYIFNIWKPIEKIKLLNPIFTYSLSPKHVKNFAFWGYILYVIWPR